MSTIKPLLKNSQNKGFTLIELLIVIAVIGVLSTLVVISVQRAIVMARDAQRIHDFEILAKAIEIYAIDNNDNYPFSFPNSRASTAPAYGNWETELGVALQDYIPKMPYPAKILGVSWHYWYQGNNDPNTPINITSGGQCLVIYKGAYIWTRFELTNDLTKNDGGPNDLAYEILMGEYIIIPGPCP